MAIDKHDPKYGVQVTVRIKEELMGAIDRFAASRQVSRPEAIRELAEKAVRRIELDSSRHKGPKAPKAPKEVR
jgi:metal-responsive CopG/Arc/MetJ family transcriptional regulator